jgi:tetratricopeptide (TPR) repeat protein
MEGRSALALEHGRKVAGNVSPELVAQLPMIEFVPPVPVLTMVRFGRWDEVLAEPAPAASMRYASGIWHYARGMAHAAKQDEAKARTALDSVRAIAAAMPPEQMVSTNYAKALLEVAGQVLVGEIARRAGRHDEAITHLRAAAVLEDGLTFDEPPTWYYPVRQSLGAALLAAGRAGEAEAVYRADLGRFPDNGWSLKGLEQALRAQGKTKDADATAARFKTAWARADAEIPASVF